MISIVEIALTVGLGFNTLSIWWLIKSNIQRDIKISELQVEAYRIKYFYQYGRMDKDGAQIPRVAEDTKVAE